MKRLFIFCIVVTVIAFALSLFAHIPYIYTFITVSALVFVGHLITLDDDLPGGWSNPDGDIPFPWKELLIKLAVLIGLLIILFKFPQIELWGK